MLDLNLLPTSKRNVLLNAVDQSFE
jgi:hypothetical protein